MSQTATCACGQLSAVCAEPPLKVSLCYCLDCQKRTGSTFGVAAFFRRDNVRTAGRFSTFKRASDSGFEVAFHFCPTCGSTVFWEPQRRPNLIAVAVGAFADPGFLPPSQAVYEESRHPWVCVTGV